VGDPPDGAGTDLSTEVEAVLDRLVPAGGPWGRVGVALSGGSDSMALTAIAAGWARRHGRELAGVTVDHGLRAASAGEAAFAGAFCKRLGLPHSVLRAGPMGPGNLPAAARDQRYRLLAEWARAGRVAGVLLGHTMDDQAETLLMRLARGSGVEGLSGMAPRRDWAGVAWLRPLLGVRRKALRDWLSARGIAWIDDPTNADPAYDRVKARRALALLAPLGLTVEGLAETAARFDRQRRVLLRAAAETAAAALAWGEFGEARLALAPLRATERDTGLRVFAETLVRVAGRRYRPRFRAVEPALARLLGGAGAGMTLGGCLVVPDLEGGRVLICREPSAVAGPVPLAPPAVIWDGRWRVSAPVVSPAPAGLHVGALGAAGCDRLSRDAASGAWMPPAAWRAAPRPVRETAPAVYASAACTAGELLAVPAAGYVAEGAPPGVAGIAAEPLRGTDAGR
jgi:tRNA(Ile)-lysidine synthase